MSDVIQTRTEFDVGQATYLTCADERILGMDSCGCGEPSTREIKKFKLGGIEGFQVTFHHIGSRRCLTVVRRDPKTDEWIPLTWDEYHNLTMETAD